MRSTLKAAGLAAAAALALSGCASIVSGTTDHVEISSEQPGQECVVYQGGRSVAQVTTPASVAVERTSSSLLVTCGGMQAKEKSGFNWWTLGNFLMFPPGGTIIGLLIDTITGAYHGYDAVVVK